ncbi:glutathione S-transferase family protein [Parasedimentitalea huanghaiensis]|uniref:Glutathione S-transferase n=1 Tax=Parasedimentitalea huanghaiensis TaxID=2682100 RepID=A0A6L6WLP0_9RHOB|nr:glutathione S-transferase family protein [Zongyanglinia huanghaiensis]MVO17535.1 glutathione S-transferase [Zongyanglinia huanghaiensis]
MLQVLGRPNSVNVQKVMWCLAELGLTADRSDIGGAFGGNDAADYLGMNPNGKIPTLIDGDYVLWESNAIVRYLCDQYRAGHWYPDTAQQLGHANQWMDWYQTALHRPMTTLFWQLIRTSPEQRDQAAVDSAIKECAGFWKMLDHHLADRDYILGDHLSMADIPLGCAAYRWHSMNFERPGLPALKNWWTRISERPAYQTHVMLPLT